MSTISELADSPMITLQPAVMMPTVWIGGQSSAALRRTIRFGDGWLSGLQPLAVFSDNVDRLRELADAAGRPTPRLGAGVHVGDGRRGGQVSIGSTAEAIAATYGMTADQAESLAIAGTPEQVAEQLSAFVEAGAHTFAVISEVTPWGESAELLAEVRRLLNV